MTENIAHYLSPLIFPLFPADAGTLYLDYDLGHVLRVRGGGGFTGRLTVSIRQYADGECLDEDSWSVEVADNVVADPLMRRQLAGDRLGYVEIHIEADAPAFRKILSPPGYALLRTPSGSAVIVVADQKYANPRVIDEIRGTGKFCMVHTAAFVDPQAGLGNSLLLINPYEQALTARIHGEEGRKMSQRVASRSSVLVSLEAVLPPGRWGSYMVTGNNRVVTYDLRHAYGRPSALTSMDHLDVFSGMRTHRQDGAVDWARSAARRFLREQGIRYT